MNPREYPERPFVGVGVVVLKGEQVLLVRRAKPPLSDAWSIPGGAQEIGETVREAGLRELAEETGVTAEIGGLVDVVDAIRLDAAARVQIHYTLVDFWAEWRAGEPAADDDVSDARWFPLTAVDDLPMWEETRRIIRKAVALRADTRRTP